MPEASGEERARGAAGLVILAAGAGTRLGGVAKALLTLSDGRTFLEAIVAPALDEAAKPILAKKANLRVLIADFRSFASHRVYDVRTQHTNADFYERVSEKDLQQSAIVMAVFAWQAAIRDGKIPR